MTKKQKTFHSVSSVWRVDSRMPSSETRRGAHGWPDEKKYQRSASAPNVSKTCQGSMTLPLDFDIFWPVARRRCARGTRRCGTASAPNTSVLTASSE